MINTINFKKIDLINFLKYQIYNTKNIDHLLAKINK